MGAIALSFLFLPLLLQSTLAQSVVYTKDSGICETTPGVATYSGYINLDDNSDDAFWFWFFEARSDPDDKPLTIWLNGGPGCSSMIGLFQEHGPCTVNEDEKTTTYNPYSWNNYTNMLYIDQPFGAGFSTGRKINNTDQAAKYLWNGLQVWFANDTFSKYTDNEFILATESYGARFGPVFTQYFHSQNDKIDSGDVDGEKIVVSKLIINNGKHDPIIQMNSSIAFARDAPGYGALISNTTLLDDLQIVFNKECEPALRDCYDDGKDSTCQDAIMLCTHKISVPTFGNRNPDDLRRMDSSAGDAEEENGDDYSATFPPTYYASFIRRAGIKKAIGAKGQSFDQCDSSIKFRFSGEGETGRSFLSNLAQLADDKEVDILIWAGDSDMKANWLGVHDCVAQMPWWGNETFANMDFTNLTLDGDVVGTYKVVPDGGVKFVRVFEAGHTMPAYQPKTAQTVFARFINNENIGSAVSDSSTAGGDDSDGSIAISSTSISLWSTLSLLLGVYLASRTFSSS
ncbi:alpha/beta-hydrolase [Hymenopellis radicata]|nr:alpha/beta-hydrolase [Hymenopellis radicata]